MEPQQRDLALEPRVATPEPVEEYELPVTDHSLDDSY